MKAQMKKGIIDIVLLSILSSKDAYAYELYIEINEFLPISKSTLYPILRQLEEDKILKSNSRIFQGRIRKYYGLTRHGKKYLSQKMIEIDELKNVIEMIEINIEGILKK